MSGKLCDLMKNVFKSYEHIKICCAEISLEHVFLILKTCENYYVDMHCKMEWAFSIKKWMNLDWKEVKYHMTGDLNMIDAEKHITRM